MIMIQEGCDRMRSQGSQQMTKIPILMMEDTMSHR